MGTILKLNTKTLVYYTQKGGKILFVRTQMGICYLGVVQVTSNVMWIKYKWNLHVVHMSYICLIFLEISLNYYIRIWLFEIPVKIRPFIMFIWCKFEVPNLLLNMLSVPTIWEFIRFHVLNEYFYIVESIKLNMAPWANIIMIDGTHGHIITN
jgi:hypothetical protein